MLTYLTPGVYFERPEPRLAPPQRRTDVAGFVGMAERGPLHTPVRLTTWRQFQQVFGRFLPNANLALAVHAFFENGGRTCWVVRVAHTAAARSASCQIPDGGSPARVAYAVYAIHPGTWGNQLEVSVQSARLGASQHRPIAVTPENAPQVANYLLVENIAGLEAGSRLRLTQAFDPPVQAVAVVQSVDGVQGGLTLDITLPDHGFNHMETTAPAISIESLEFTLLVWQDGQIAERFDNLAPEPTHSRYAPAIANAESRLLQLQRGSGDGLPDRPWREALQHGLNGLRSLTIYDYTGTPQGDAYGLATLAPIDEISILAMPDLTLVPQPPTPLARAPRHRIAPCALDTPSDRLTLRGTLVDAETTLPLTGVTVELDDGIQLHQTESDRQGAFVLTDVLPDRLELVLTLAGYEQRVYAVPSLGRASEQDLGTLPLTPLDLPPAFDERDIFYGQMAMVAQCEQLRDRFALIDPPQAPGGRRLDLSGVQGWRARFSSAFAALYYPWLLVRDPLRPNANEGRWLPPSGHVAGVYAATDLAEGVFRPPANRRLALVEDVGQSVDDATQGVLNPQGVNVIRVLPGRGIRVYGARTLSRDSAWRFVNVRRLLSMLEEVIYDSLQWAVFEPNDASLWFGVRLTLVTLLDSLWRQGAFVGDTPDAAYEVRCDAVTTTPTDQAEGRAIARVSVAPTVPYEFIVLRLGLTTDELQISEV